VTNAHYIVHAKTSGEALRIYDAIRFRMPAVHNQEKGDGGTIP
jgi:hypothetical protein